MMLIDRVGDFTHSVSAFCNYSISHQLIHDFIVYIEGQTYLRRHDSDEYAFKPAVLADIGKQMFNVAILFTKKLAYAP